MSELNDLVERLVERFLGAQHALALTGAGVSTESGIPDFRSPSSGLWKDHDPMEIASIQGFRSDPSAFYAFWGERFGALAEAQPNQSHEVLAMLESEGRLRRVITQNIDGLHTDAGSKDVLEVHGTFRRASCVRCNAGCSLDEVLSYVRETGRAPTCEVCGGLIKPDVVLFGEDLPASFREAERLTRDADLFVVLGSSLGVYPVAELAPLAKRRGAFLAIINREPGPFDDVADLVIHAELGETMRLLRALLRA